MQERELQQSVFLRMSRVVSNQPCVVQAADRVTFPAQHLQELQKEFDMADIHRTGLLSRNEIKTYVQEKCQKVNMPVLDSLLDEMQWKNNVVTRKEFCERYLERQRSLASRINRLKIYEQVLDWNRRMLAENTETSVFGSISIQRLWLPDREIQTETYDLDFLYEDQKKGKLYELTIKHYDPAEVSPKILMPIMPDNLRLMVTVRFLARGVFVAKGFISVDVRGMRDETNRREKFGLTLEGVRKGQMEAFIEIQNVSSVQSHLAEETGNIPRVARELQGDIHHLQYLEYLWGMSSTTAEIRPSEVKCIIIVRWIFFVLLFFGGIGCNLCGRYDALTLVMALLTLKLIRYVWLREDVVLMLCVNCISMLSDGAWIAFTETLGTQSPINYQDATHAKIITVLLFGVKFALLLWQILSNKATQ